jgi:hypothetical protein
MDSHDYIPRLSKGRGWRDLEEIENDCEPLYCRSVGWLVAEKNGHKTIVPHLSGEKNEGIIITGTGDLTIPDKAIRRVVILRKS